MTTSKEMIIKVEGITRVSKLFKDAKSLQTELRRKYIELMINVSDEVIIEIKGIENELYKME